MTHPDILRAREAITQSLPKLTPLDTLRLAATCDALLGTDGHWLVSTAIDLEPEAAQPYAMPSQFSRRREKRRHQVKGGCHE